jgi:hypothetical protein
MQYKHVKTLDNPVVLLAGVHPMFCSPNGPLLVESMYQNITYIFKYMYEQIDILQLFYLHALWLSKG